MPADAEGAAEAEENARAVVDGTTRVEVVVRVEVRTRRAAIMMIRDKSQRATQEWTRKNRQKRLGVEIR